MPFLIYFCRRQFAFAVMLFAFAAILFAFVVTVVGHRRLESSTEVLFEIVSDANYVIIINNLVLNIPDRRFDCKLVDFCCDSCRPP